MFDRYNFDAILIWFNWEVGKIKNEKKRKKIIKHLRERLIVEITADTRNHLS